MASRRASSVPSPTTGRSRRSSSAAFHRRPFWAKNETALEAYRNPWRESAAPIGRGRSIDYGTDNFSYDDSHLQHFELSNEITLHLTPELLAKAQEYIMAGAALITAVARVRDTYSRAVHCAYPRKSSATLEHLSLKSPSTTGSDSRRTSAADSIMVGSSSDENGEYDTPPESIPDTPVTSPSSPSLAWWTILPDKDALMNGISQAAMDDSQTRPIEIVSMESPPFSPWDAKLAKTDYATPVTSVTTSFGSDHATQNVGNAYMPKAKYASTGPNTKPQALRSPSLTSLDSSPSPRDPLTSYPTTPDFCERSWEYYLGGYNELLLDTKECILRLRGYSRNIQILRTELRSETTKPEAVIALINFGKWFEKSQKKVRECEDEYQELPVPELEQVEREWYAMVASGSFGSEEAAY